jgi:integrase
MSLREGRVFGFDVGVMIRKIKGLRKKGKKFVYQPQRDGRRHYIPLDTMDEHEAIRLALAWDASPALQESGAWEFELARYINTRVGAEKLTADYARARKYICLVFGRRFEIRHPREVTAVQLRKWYAELKATKKAQTAHHYIQHVRSFLGWLVKMNVLPRNVASEVEMDNHMPIGRKVFVEKEGVAAILQAATDRDLKLILFLGFDAGFRKNEISEARIDWFNLNQGTVTIRRTESFKPKTREERTLPLTTRLVDYLKEKGLGDGPFLIRLDIVQGTWRYRYDFVKLLKNHLNACGFPEITAHDMRRSFASNRVMAGVSIPQIADWLGDTIETCERHYAHFVPKTGEIDKGV